MLPAAGVWSLRRMPLPAAVLIRLTMVGPALRGTSVPSVSEVTANEAPTSTQDEAASKIQKSFGGGKSSEAMSLNCATMAY